MQQLFVEMYSYKQKWIELSVPEREAFVGTVLDVLAGLQTEGVEILGYAVNDPVTDRRAPYDFFCVYRVPDADLQRGFESGIKASGWYDYFDQVNLSGAVDTAAEVLANNVLLQTVTAQGQ
ncbi:hypothetical protein M1247_25840 [Mycobacterium sp. 21AC1]|uniref:DUF6616 family protein n=1 Tax=[Mycobacterium] appelbergii TaxID=2939269 RepID=UPI002938F052|nr:DUF6616 family protein [Mycobacterium sp. 21AC1]MDV3128360.1 hypothetical protein [Mycobacterium sp. 21AC1]